MPTIIPHSYRFGDNNFPYAGRIQPGFYRVFSWILDIHGTKYFSGRIPITSADQITNAIKSLSVNNVSLSAYSSGVGINAATSPCTKVTVSHNNIGISVNVK